MSSHRAATGARMASTQLLNLGDLANTLQGVTSKPRSGKQPGLLYRGGLAAKLQASQRRPIGPFFQNVEANMCAWASATRALAKHPHKRYTHAKQGSATKLGSGLDVANDAHCDGLDGANGWTSRMVDVAMGCTSQMAGRRNGLDVANDAHSVSVLHCCVHRLQVALRAA